MAFCDNLSAALKLRKMTRKEASRRCGISYSAMRRYFDGDRFPGGDVLERLGRVLDVSVDWLLTGEGPVTRMFSPSSVAEAETIYMNDDLLKKICQMVLKMDKEAKQDLLKHIEDRELLAELHKERSKLKIG
ncbi:MAG TPA: helix-turn-helix domain-containing protein [Acidobacteriota bacterium]|jgi:transcriptional regulator with XRE-family HTH domain|nr:helix-turn-helix domain-containing protein [Acidobacteriota bacterium]